MNTETIIAALCYNEANRLNSKPFHAFDERCVANHLLFLNDGRPNNTLPPPQRLQQRQPLQIALLDLDKNSSQAMDV